MRFTVTWHPAAEQELASLWLEKTERDEIARAANSIDQLLSANPLAQGEEFYGDRLLVVLPLAVTYTVNDPDCTVRILQVWHQ